MCLEDNCLNNFESSVIIKWFIAAMLDYSFVFVWMQMTMNLRTWRLFIFLLKSLVCLLSCQVVYLKSSRSKSDSFFDNVCELDLVFNFYKVCWCFLLLSYYISLSEFSGVCNFG